jgi:hypothetical protein
VSADLRGNRVPLFNEAGRPTNQFGTGRLCDPCGNLAERWRLRIGTSRDRQDRDRDGLHEQEPPHQTPHGTLSTTDAQQ